MIELLCSGTWWQGQLAYNSKFGVSHAKMDNTIITPIFFGHDFKADISPTLKHQTNDNETYLGLVLYSKGIQGHSKMMRFNTKQSCFVVNISTLQQPQHSYKLQFWRKITKGKFSISRKFLIQKYELSKTCCTHSKVPDISITFTCKASWLVYQLPKSQQAKLQNKSVTLPPKTLRFAAALTKLIFTISNTKFFTVFTLDIPSEKKITKKHQFVQFRWFIFMHGMKASNMFHLKTFILGEEH
jgi:hypothetical protein